MMQCVCRCRYLQSEGECSLIIRDGVANRTARDWLEQACHIPEYTDPFGHDVDTSLITPRVPKVDEEPVDSAQVRIFVFMKDKPHIDSNEEGFPDSPRPPPWDISTNPELAPKYLPNGALNPARLRPSSANCCHHFNGPPTVRPFSAPCGFSEYANWKHPMDMQPYLSLSEMANFRKYSSVTDLRASERNPAVREKASRLLSARSSKG